MAPTPQRWEGLDTPGRLRPRKGASQGAVPPSADTASLGGRGLATADAARARRTSNQPERQALLPATRALRRGELCALCAPTFKTGKSTDSVYNRLRGS